MYRDCSGIIVCCLNKADTERSLRRENTLEELRIAKEKGIQGGRKCIGLKQTILPWHGVLT